MVPVYPPLTPLLPLPALWQVDLSGPSVGLLLTDDCLQNYYIIITTILLLLSFLFCHPTILILYVFKIHKYSGLVINTVPNSEKVLGFDSQGLSMWSLHVLPVLVWVFCGCSRFPHHQNMYIRCAALWLPTAPQGWVKCRKHISLYTAYVTNKVSLCVCVCV